MFLGGRGEPLRGQFVEFDKLEGVPGRGGVALQLLEEVVEVRPVKGGRGGRGQVVAGGGRSFLAVGTQQEQQADVGRVGVAQGQALQLLQGQAGQRVRVLQQAQELGSGHFYTKWNLGQSIAKPGTKA